MIYSLLLLLLQVSSGKEIETQLLSVRDILADANNDWEKRIEAVRYTKVLFFYGFFFFCFV